MIRSDSQKPAEFTGNSCRDSAKSHSRVCFQVQASEVQFSAGSQAWFVPFSTPPPPTGQERHCSACFTRVLDQSEAELQTVAPPESKTTDLK